MASDLLTSNLIEVGHVGDEEKSSLLVRYHVVLAAVSLHLEFVVPEDVPIRRLLVEVRAVKNHDFLGVPHDSVARHSVVVSVGNAEDGRLEQLLGR